MSDQSAGGLSRPAADGPRARPPPVDDRPVLPARDQSRQRTGSRQDGSRRSVQHRGRRPRPGDTSGHRHAPCGRPRVCGEDRAPAVAQSPRPSPGTRTGHRRVSGLLLSLPRHRDRAPRLELRALDARFGVPARRSAHVRDLLRRRHRGRGGSPAPRRHVVPSCQLAMGTGWRPDAHARLEARDGLSAAPLRRLRRGPPALSARPRFSDVSAAAGELRRLLRHLSVERASTAASCSTRGRSSPISSRISGSTFAGFATPSCASAAATTS